MARFHHTVTVTALDHAWFEECAALLLDVVESTRTGAGGALLGDGEPVPGMRLVKGRHLRAGARHTFASHPAPSRPLGAPEGPVRGRALVRPPAALVPLLFRIPLERAFRSGVDGAAARWNETLGGGLPSPEALRAEFTEAVAARNPPAGAPG